MRWSRVKVTSEASYGYERSELWSCSMTFLWRKVLECSSSPCSLRHPCVLTHSYGGRFWSVLPHTAHFVIPVSSLLWRKVLECSSSPCSLRHPCDLTLMEEGSGVFFLTLLTSSSLCSHSYGGSFWSVLPHTAHFVIPVISLLWRKVLECSSSHCSLRHPCVLTHSYGGRFWSVLPHCSLRHPCDLTLMEEGSGVFFLTLLTSSSLCSHTHDLSSHPSHRYP